MLSQEADTDGELAWSELSRRGTRAALQLAVRSLALRAVTFVGLIALARLLAPTDFGVFAIVSFVVSVWAALGDFGLGAALVQQEEEPTAAQLATAWTLQQATALAAIAVIWLLAPGLAGLIPTLPPDTAWMLRVLSLGLLLSSLRTLPSVMMERQLRFGPLAAAEVAQQVTYYTLAIALAVAGFRAWSFVVAGIGQLAVGALVVNLAWRIRPAIGVDRDCLKRLLGFGFRYQLSLLLMALRDTPLPVMAGLVAGAASAGLLQFAMRIALTMASIDEVVGRIAFPAFSRLQGRPHEQARALDAAILLTALVMVPVQCLLAALAPVVIPAVFGAGWVPAILPLQLICVAALFRFPARYLRQTVFAEGDSRRGLAIAAVCLVVAVGSFVPALLLLGLAGTGLGFLVGAVLGMTATAWLSRRFVRLDWRPFGRLVSAGLLAGASALLAMQMSRTWLAGSQVGGTPLVDWISVILSTVLFALLFGGLTWLLEGRLLCLGIRLARQAARYQAF